MSSGSSDSKAKSASKDEDGSSSDVSGEYSRENSKGKPFTAISFHLNSIYDYSSINYSTIIKMG